MTEKPEQDVRWTDNTMIDQVRLKQLLKAEAECEALRRELESAHLNAELLKDAIVSTLAGDQGWKEELNGAYFRYLSGKPCQPYEQEMRARADAEAECEALRRELVVMTAECEHEQQQRHLEADRAEALREAKSVLQQVLDEVGHPGTGMSNATFERIRCSLGGGDD